MRVPPSLNASETPNTREEERVSSFVFESCSPPPTTTSPRPRARRRQQHAPASQCSPFRDHNQIYTRVDALNGGRFVVHGYRQAALLLVRIARQQRQRGHDDRTRPAEHERVSQER